MGKWGKVASCIVLAVVLAVLVGAARVDGQTRDRAERTPEQLRQLEERHERLAAVSEAATREIRIEQSRRKAPFDLWWGVR